MHGRRIVTVLGRRMPRHARNIIPATLSRLIQPSTHSPTTAVFSPVNVFATVREFQSEASFHTVADETLDEIQDAMEVVFEQLGDTDEELEVSVASGVLTLALPPYGTWVINKQTPNQQIWWSSPLSGPRRYEYENNRWVYTRSIDEQKKDESAESRSTLGAALKEEIRRLYDIDLDLNV